MTHKSWLWPDHTIGRKESRSLREEHNALVNSHAELLEALKESIQKDKQRLKSNCLHDAAIKTAASNNWDYAYALGYVSGQFDKLDNRPAEHKTSETDDYALGYHKGYSSLA